jgi:hypothetical protein
LTILTISVLPLLLKEFPKAKKDIKLILLLNLFNDYPVDMAGTPFSAFSIMAIHLLWENNPNDAESILFGYLLLKSKYDKLRRRLSRENNQKGIYELYENQIIEEFLKENETNLKAIYEDTISKDYSEDIEKLDLHILRTAFLLIPRITDNKVYKEIVKQITRTFTKNLLSRQRDDRVDYRVRNDYLEKYSYFVLNSPKEEISEYLKPFLDSFNGSEAIADLFQKFILAEDNLNSYENFWEVWDLFKNKVIELCKDGDEFWYVDRIVNSYLFAQTIWKETATEWRTFKDENRIFFKEMAEKLGHCPSALYAISKLLNNIGSPYLNDGVSWLSSMLEKNKNLLDAKLENDTMRFSIP